MNILIFCICLVLLFTLYYRWFFGFWKSKNVKTLPPNPFFGNLTDVLLGKIPGFRMFEKAYKTSMSNGYKYIGYYFLGKPVLLATDLDLIKQILITDFNSFCDREFYLNKDIDPMGVHLIAMRGTDWKQSRRLLTPAFTASKLKTFYPLINSVGEELKSVLDATLTESINVKNIVSKFIFDSISMCIFGLEANTLKNQNLELKHYATKITGGNLVQNIKLFFCLINPNVLYFLRIPFNSYDVQDYFLNLTKNTVEQREKHKIVRKDLMDLLIQLRNNIDIEDNKENIGASETVNKNVPKSLSIQQIAAQTLIFFAVGYDTTTTSVNNAIYELLRNESVLEKAILEVNSVIKKHNGQITYDALSEMTYLECIVNESVRMYPIATILSRVSTKDYKMPNSELIVEIGTTIFIPAYEIFHDSKYFEDPEEFKPERFSVGSDLMIHHKMSWLGFGGGPRKCIGERFGLLMAKSFLCTILYNYKISFNPKIKLPLQFDKNNMIVSLKDDLLVDFRRINV